MICASRSCCSLVSNRILSGAALLCVCLSLAGCPSGDSYETVTSEDADRAEEHADHDHHHVHTAPHGGHLIELGTHQYNAEVVLENEPKQLVVYLLDAHAENAVGIASESIVFIPDGAEPISLESQPQDTDAAGESSRFAAAGPVVAGMTDLEDVHGSIKVTIAGTDYTGQLSHDHDGHDHDDHEHGEHEGAGHDHDGGHHADEAHKDAPASE